MINGEVWRAYSLPKKFFIGSSIVASVFLVGVVVVAVSSFVNGTFEDTLSSPGAPVPGSNGFSSYDMDTDEVYSEKLGSTVSTRSTSPTVPQYGMTVGGDAEAYESLSYNVKYKKPDHTATCATIASWKPLGHVVFEYVETGDNFCTYRFKVERTQAEVIVNELTALTPEDMTVSTESVKKQVMEYDSQLDILLRKEEVLQNMLDEAERSYDALTQLATQVEDVESLTKILNSKLSTIERLTNERIMLSQQIDSLARRSAELQDKIEYVRFDVHVAKYKVLDGAVIKNSWEYALRQFVLEFNSAVQKLSIGLLLTLVSFLLIVIYGFIFGGLLLVVVKVAWRNGKRVWNDTPNVDTQ